MDADVDGDVVLFSGFAEADDKFRVLDGFAEGIRADVVGGFGEEERLGTCAGSFLDERLGTGEVLG